MLSLEPHVFTLRLKDTYKYSSLKLPGGSYCSSSWGTASQECPSHAASQEPASQELHQGAGTHRPPPAPGGAAHRPGAGTGPITGGIPPGSTAVSMGADTNLSSQALTHSDSRLRTCRSASPGPRGQDSRLFVPAPQGAGANPLLCPPPYRPNPSSELTPAGPP